MYSCHAHATHCEMLSGSAEDVRVSYSTAAGCVGQQCGAGEALPRTWPHLHGGGLQSIVVVQLAYASTNHMHVNISESPPPYGVAAIY